MPIYTLLFIIYHLFFILALNVSDDIALADLAALLSIDFHELTTKSGWHCLKLTPWSEDVAEYVAFLVLLADEWLYGWCALAFAWNSQKI